MTTALDTNALLALLYDGDHGEASEAAIRSAYRRGRVSITGIVYAELAADGHFDDRTALDRFLSDLSVQVVSPSREAQYHAGARFRDYVDRRPHGFQCPACGGMQSVECDQCGSELHHRQHIAADFLIGGHAERDANALITFDSGFYATYFPHLTVLPAAGDPD